MKSQKYMECVCICFYLILPCTVYVSATPKPSSGYKDIYLEAPGSDIDVIIPLLERKSDNVRTYVQVKRPSDKSKLGKLRSESFAYKNIERSDTSPDKEFSERFLFLKNHPRLPPHPPTRHHPPGHPPRPSHGPRKHPSRPHHGPPPHRFEPYPHSDHGSNNIFDPPHDFDFDPPYFMNEEHDFHFPNADEYFGEQNFNPEAPQPESFRFPSDEHDRPTPPHPPHFPPSHPPRHPPSYSSTNFPHVPDHINFITEESIYRGDVPFKETHNDRDRIHPGLVPAGVNGIEPGLGALLNQSARPYFVT